MKGDRQVTTKQRNELWASETLGASAFPQIRGTVGDGKGHAFAYQERVALEG